MTAKEKLDLSIDLANIKKYHQDNSFNSRKNLKLMIDRLIKIAEDLLK